MDTFGRRGTCKLCKHQFHDEECKKCEKNGISCKVCVSAKDAMSDQLLDFGFKLCIVDEAHSFKNTDSQRSIALTAFLKELERSETTVSLDFTCPLCKEKWQESATIKASTTDAEQRVSKTSHCPACFAQCQQSAVAHLKVKRNCGIVMLTGTPIKNRADEWQVPLNLAAPEVFPTTAGFRREWIDETGKRIKAWKMDDFRKKIAPFVLRREKQDVYTDLPKFNRIFTPITVSDERLKKAYNRVLDTIEEGSPRGNYSYFSNIGELQQLRQICGLAKVNWAADYAETFIADSEKAKLAIGVHHHSVRDALAFQLENFGVCKLDGEDSPERKDYIAHKYFQKSPEQILLLGMMAAKEGLELVYIDTALVVEREWSSADEEQFEYRFYNPDLGFLKSRGLENKSTNVEYLLAKGTIDEFFYNLVEEKRQIFGETLGSDWDLQGDSTSFQELMEQTLGSRL
jgi:SNF2 family DNA or RNA helicase